MRVDAETELPKVMIRVHILCEQYARAQDPGQKRKLLNDFSQLIGHAAEVAAWDIVALIRERELAVEDAYDDADFRAERDRGVERLQGYGQP